MAQKKIFKFNLFQLTQFISVVTDTHTHIHTYIHTTVGRTVRERIEWKKCMQNQMKPGGALYLFAESKMAPKTYFAGIKISCSF